LFLLSCLKRGKEKKTHAGSKTLPASIKEKEIVPDKPSSPQCFFALVEEFNLINCLVSLIPFKTFFPTLFVSGDFSA